MSEEVKQDYSDYERTLPTPTAEPPKVNYVDNDEFLAAYVAYQQKRKEHKEQGLLEPEIPRYIVECIMSICRRTAYKYNFINYSYQEEMIGDAIIACLAGINSFDVKRNNIFSYYTTAAWNAFVRRIKKEKHQAKVKGRMITEIDVDSIVTQEHDNNDFQVEFLKYMKEAEDYRTEYEKHNQYKELTKEDKSEEFENALVFDGDEE